MVAENRRVSTLSNISPYSWYLIFFEDKEGSKSVEIDMLCFWHIVHTFSEFFKSLYRVFLVLSDSLEVLSCIGWKMDHLEQKRQKRIQIGDFHAEQTSRAPGYLPQWHRSLRKLQDISRFSLIILIFSLSRHGPLHIFSSTFVLFSTLLFTGKKNSRAFHIAILLPCKERRPFISFRKELHEPYFYFFYNRSDVLSSFNLSVFLLHGWVVGLFSLGCSGVIFVS